MACQRRCRDVDVPHKAVVNCDALCSTFSDALRFVHLDMVNTTQGNRGMLSPWATTISGTL